MESNKIFNLGVKGILLEVFRTRGIGPQVNDSLDCEKGLISYINNAKESIIIAIYSINSPPIAEALISAYKRGILVYGVADNLQWCGKTSKAQYLVDNGIKLLRAKNQPRCMHLKMLIVDEHVVCTGSFNFTQRAEGSKTNKKDGKEISVHSNDEVLIVNDSKELAAILKEQVDEIVKLNSGALNAKVE